MAFSWWDRFVRVVYPASSAPSTAHPAARHATALITLPAFLTVAVATSPPSPSSHSETHAKEVRMPPPVMSSSAGH
jgi:hypothetical protein